MGWNFNIYINITVKTHISTSKTEKSIKFPRKKAFLNLTFLSKRSILFLIAFNCNNYKNRLEKQKWLKNCKDC